MDPSNASNQLKKFILANINFLEEVLSVDVVLGYYDDPVKVLDVFLQVIEKTGPERLKRLDFLPWKELTGEDRLRAMRVLLWGQRAGQLKDQQTQQLQIDKVHYQNSTEEDPLHYFYLCALTNTTEPEHDSIEEFILNHRHSEDLVGAALMTLPRTRLSIDFYLDLQLQSPANCFELYRVVLRHYVSDGKYVRQCLSCLYRLLNTAFARLAVKQTEDLSGLVDALCSVDISQPDARILLQIAFPEFTEKLKEKPISEHLQSITNPLIDAVAHPSLLSLQLLFPVFQLLMGHGHLEHPFIAQIKTRLLRERTHSQELIEMLQRLCRVDREYKQRIRYEMQQGLERNPSDTELLTIAKALYPGSIEERVSESFLKCSPSESQSLSHFRGFLEALISQVKPKCPISLPSKDIIQVLDLASDLSNSSLYTYSQLVNVWQTKGILNYNQLLVGNSWEVDVYLSIFSLLSKMEIGKEIDASNTHPVMPLFAGSQLLRLFQVNLPKADTQDSMYFEAAKHLNKASIELMQLEYGGVTAIPEADFAWLFPFISSPIVSTVYRKLNLTLLDFHALRGKAFYAAIKSHGITIFGGIILIRKEYKSHALKDRCGLLISMYHELCHYCRKMRNGKFDYTALTPLKDLKEGMKELETKGGSYLAGTPGDGNSFRYRSAGSGPNQGEGGWQAEVKLFGCVIETITEQQAEFLVNPTNWQTLRRKQFTNQLGALGRMKTQTYFSYKRDEYLYTYDRTDHRYLYS